MSGKQLAVLSIINFMPFFVGQASLPLLPVYALQLGADEGISGLFLAFVFGSLAVGTLIGGWLSNRFQRRRLTLIIGALLTAATNLLIGLAGDIVSLTITSMIVWLFGGIVVATVSIMVGMFAPSESRGRVFGIMGVGIALGQVIGGLVAGPIVDQWGFRILFYLSALPYVIATIASFFVEDKVVRRQTEAANAAQISPPSRAFNLLLVATLLAATAQFSTVLGRSLAMNTQGFDATAISSMSIAGGVITLPLPFFIGWLSDRLGRRQLLFFAYFSAILSCLMLLSSVDLWHFWLGAILGSLYGSGGTAVGSAFVTDLVRPERLSIALSRFGSMPWIGGILGFGLTGYVIQALGFETTFLLTALLPVGSILLILSIRAARAVVSA